MNKVFLLGRAGQDPEIRYTQAGQKVANVSLATGKKYTDNQGQKREKTEWHKVVFFAGRADIIEKYVKKGSRLLVEGEIQYSESVDSSGVKKYYTSIVCESFQLLGGADNSEKGADW